MIILEANYKLGQRVDPADLIVPGKKYKDPAYMSDMEKQKHMLQSSRMAYINLSGRSVTKTLRIPKSLAEDIMSMFQWDSNEVYLTVAPHNAQDVVVNFTKESDPIAAQSSEIAVAEPAPPKPAVKSMLLKKQK